METSRHEPFPNRVKPLATNSAGTLYACASLFFSMTLPTLVGALAHDTSQAVCVGTDGRWKEE